MIEGEDPELHFNCTGNLDYGGLKFSYEGSSKAHLFYSYREDVVGIGELKDWTRLAFAVDVINNRVGVNTPSPDVDFHVVGKSKFEANNVFLDLNSSGSGSGGNGIRFYNGASINGALWFDETDNYLNLSNSFSAQGLFVDLSNNRVGIGKDNPTTTLDVNGDITLRQNTANIEFRNGNGYSRGRLNIDEPNTVMNLKSINKLNLEAAQGLKLNTNGVDRMVISQSGNIGIGVSSPMFSLQVDGNVDIIGELTTSSDRRLKTNIKPIVNALSVIGRLNPVQFLYRTEEFTEMKLSEGQHWGLLAQEVQEVLPELVSMAGTAEPTDGESFDYLSVNYMELIPVLLKSIQELEARVSQLEAELDTRLAAEEE